MIASSGTKGKASSVPSDLAMARFWSDGVGEKGRRAWPPNKSSKERIVDRICDVRERDIFAESERFLKACD